MISEVEKRYNVIGEILVHVHDFTCFGLNLLEPLYGYCITYDHMSTIKNDN